MYQRSGILVKQKFREYLIPTVLTSMAISMASVVDGIIVGSLLGDTALAAVGLSSPVIFCINLIYMLFAVGGLTCASIALGKRDTRRANQIFTLSIGGGISAMFLFLLAMQIILRPLSISLAGGDAQLAVLTESYLRPLTFTGLPLMFSSGMAMFIRTDGNPRASAVIVVIANAVNLVLDYVMIRFMGTVIWGAGFSTTMGYVAGSAIVIPYLVNKKRSFRFVLPGKDTLQTLSAIIKSGLPKALSQICSILRSLVLNAIIVHSLGSIGMSIMTVCTNVLMISNIFVGGVSDALLPIAGTLYGEMDYFGVRQSMKTAIRVLACTCMALLLFFMLAPQLMGMAFGIQSAEALRLLKPALRLFALYLPFSAMILLHQNFYNTTERRSLASAMVVMDGLLCVVPLAALFSWIHPNLLWLCYAASGACTLLAMVSLAKRIQKKENLHDLLLIPKLPEAAKRFDFSITASPEEAVRLSERVLELADQNPGDARLLGRIALILKEMVVAAAHYAHADSNRGLVDILVHITDEQVTIQMRDNGIAFNPLEYIPEENDGCITDNLQQVKKLANRMEYSRQLGFNTSVLTIERGKA